MIKAWRFHQLIFPILLLLCINSAFAQESTMVQVKTYDLNLNLFANLELSFDNKNYFNTGTDGSVIVETSNTLLPPKVIYFKDVKLEAESWNYSHGVLEIIVRNNHIKLIKSMW